MRVRWAVLVTIVAVLVSGLSPATANSLKDPQPNVVGGAAGDIRDIPWQVAIVDSSFDTDYDGQFCGGSILAPRWILTAAHCIKPDASPDLAPSDLLVLAGKSTLARTPEASGPYNAVAEVYVHPGWYVARDLDDIALLRLATPLSFTDSVKPVPLPKDQDPNTWPAKDTDAVISGWGLTRDGVITSAPWDLQRATVRVLDDPAQQDDPCATFAPIAPSTICAGLPEGGIDTCQGDSGGPLTVRVGDVPTLAGITARGEGCARPGKPGVYTRVTSYLTWINDHLAKDDNGQLWASGSSLAFVSQPLGSAWSVQSVRITNQGNRNVDGVSVNLEGANASSFPVSHTCPATLASGGSCLVTAGYTPDIAGDSHALVRIQPGDLRVSLSGNAFTPVPPPPPVPAKPAGVTAKAKKKAVRVRWSAVPGATQYTVRLKGNDAKKPKKKVKVTVRTASTSTVIRKALLKGATFRVCVAASNSSGSSAATCIRGMRTR